MIFSTKNQESNAIFYYMKCTDSNAIGSVIYELRTDSLLYMGYSGEQWHSKYKQTGIWWKSGESILIKEDDKPLQVYKRDTLIQSLMLISVDELDYWQANKKEVQDSILSVIEKDEWWLNTLTPDEKREAVEQMGRSAGFRRFCGREIWIGGSYKTKKKKKKHKK